MRIRFGWILVLTVLLLGGCATPKVKLFSDAADPLQEKTLEGTGKRKVLLIPVRGILSTAPQEQLLRTRPSVVQEVVAQLRKAQQDPQVRAVIFKVDSPGGTVTAADVLYHEIQAFKKRTEAKVVAMMMGVAASGGYYVALPAETIIAHPTTVTGSVGVIFLRPRVTRLMDKLGLAVEINKSGENKDMGSPFRSSSDREKEIMQNLTDALGDRFLDLVTQHRRLSPEAAATVATARIFLADDALRLGLVDRIGYMQAAVTEARALAGLDDDARLVVYRRTDYPDDTWYNDAVARHDGRQPALIDLGIEPVQPHMASGFYYLWTPGAAMP